jgi:hypothetical protein
MLHVYNMSLGIHSCFTFFVQVGGLIVRSSGQEVNRFSRLNANRIRTPFGKQHNNYYTGYSPILFYKYMPWMYYHSSLTLSFQSLSLP